MSLNSGLSDHGVGAGISTFCLGAGLSAFCVGVGSFELAIPFLELASNIWATTLLVDFKSSVLLLGSLTAGVSAGPSVVILALAKRFLSLALALLSCRLACISAVRKALTLSASTSAASIDTAPDVAASRCAALARLSSNLYAAQNERSLPAISDCWNSLKAG